MPAPLLRQGATRHLCCTGEESLDCSEAFQDIEDEDDEPEMKQEDEGAQQASNNQAERRSLFLPTS